MADTRPAEIGSARNFRLDGRLLARIWRLSKPFWVRRSAWPYWMAMTILVALAPCGSLVIAYNSKVLADMTNRIVARDVHHYWPVLWLFLSLTGLAKLVDVAMELIEGRLTLSWRQWMTTDLVDHYLSRRTYYDISQTGDMDNPDQRITDSVSTFTTVITRFPRSVLSQVAGMIAGATILATIDTRLLFAIFAYTIVHSIVLYFVYMPTIRQNFAVTVAEADLRYGLVRVRDHAETVAFYRGEGSEQRQIAGRLRAAVAKYIVVINYRSFVSGTGETFDLVWTAIPYLLLVPIFFTGQIKYGAIAQATYAALQIQLALNFFVDNLPFLTEIAPHSVRLAEIQERFHAMQAGREDPTTPRLSVDLGRGIRLDHVSLQTPGGEQRLARDVTFTLPEGENLVIVGQTGVGKSSLLRAMAGLWDRGRGAIVMPPPAQCLFLPQRPYMVLGDLRAQLAYPADRLLGDDECQATLERVDLPRLIETYSGLDNVRDWEKVLSIGEQQRIAFARILFCKPEYVFLDEATSGIDYPTERRLYGLLAEIGCTYVSVGHRASLFEHHTRALRLFAGGAWRIESIEEAMAHDAAVLGELAVRPTIAGL